MKLSLVVALASLMAPLAACAGSDVVASGQEPDAPADEQAATESSALASDCSSVLPTWIGGKVYGEDGRLINALIGISFHTASGAALDKNGEMPCDASGGKCAVYALVENVNRTLPATGAAANGSTTTWGKCVGRPTSKVFIEVYPKGPDGKTSFERYGAAVDNRLIVPGVANIIDLRLPVRADLGGNSGAIGGKVTCNGAPVKPTVIRAWSNGSGADCGIQGFAASGATDVGSYLLSNLAAGQCHAPSQLYQARVTAECNGAVTTQTKFGDVRKAATTAIDFAF